MQLFAGKTSLLKVMIVPAIILMASTHTNAQVYAKKAAFVAPKYIGLPLGAIKPKGWLRNQSVELRPH